MTVSALYFTASRAAEQALPPASRALLVRHDELQRAWSLTGWLTSPPPAELQAARLACAQDPLVEATFTLRAFGNTAASVEWEKTRAAA
ncbi:MAG: hypothetical protein H7067_07630 [Burkholderiales bacterium]|nr:hypothetical protein [Opitutaceae bacterium]